MEQILTHPAYFARPRLEAWVHVTSLQTMLGRDLWTYESTIRGWTCSTTIYQKKLSVTTFFYQSTEWFQFLYNFEMNLPTNSKMWRKTNSLRWSRQISHWTGLPMPSSRHRMAPFVWPVLAAHPSDDTAFTVSIESYRSKICKYLRLWIKKTN